MKINIITTNFFQKKNIFLENLDFENVSIGKMRLLGNAWFPSLAHRDLSIIALSDSARLLATRG